MKVSNLNSSKKRTFILRICIFCLIVSLLPGIAVTSNADDARPEAMVVGKPRELSKIIEWRNAASAGMSIAVSALERKESRGSHYRKDFPAEEKEWTGNILVHMIDKTMAVSRIKPIKP